MRKRSPPAGMIFTLSARHATVAIARRELSGSTAWSAGLARSRETLFPALPDLGNWDGSYRAYYAALSEGWEKQPRT
jgi:hypothetical protein